ncbi:MAG: peptide deformylase [Bacteroidetes bacterium]|nr:peptide deformylase [Bacteroidota bacterium]
MSVLPITVYGDKILSKKTKPIKQVDDRIIILIQNMFETMRNAQGVGLAANQVGVDKSIFVMDIKPVEGYEDFKPLVMINPEIVLESEETVYFEEGCLSLPNLRAEVERPEIIKIKYLDTDEKEQEIEADDFFARVILHEYDHLLGKMIPDRVDADIKASLKKELILIKNREAIIDYPVTKKE